MNHVKAFLAGFFSTLIFHQGVIALFGMLEDIPFKAYNLNPTKPLGVPSVLSLAFFAGLWGVIIWLMVRNKSQKSKLISCVILGALLPTLVAFAVVMPLKGIPIKWNFIPYGLILNGIWGLGLWTLMYLMNSIRSTSKA